MIYEMFIFWYPISIVVCFLFYVISLTQFDKQDLSYGEMMPQFVIACIPGVNVLVVLLHILIYITNAIPYGWTKRTAIKARK